MHVSARASILIKPGQIRVRSGSDPDYYPGQWVIRVSDVDPVSTLVPLKNDVTFKDNVTLTHISLPSKFMQLSETSILALSDIHQLQSMLDNCQVHLINDRITFIILNICS